MEQWTCDYGPVDMCIWPCGHVTLPLWSAERGQADCAASVSAAVEAAAVPGAAAAGWQLGGGHGGGAAGSEGRPAHLPPLPGPLPLLLPLGQAGHSLCAHATGWLLMLAGSPPPHPQPRGTLPLAVTLSKSAPCIHPLLHASAAYMWPVVRPMELVWYHARS